jgi:hypothetical protein
MYMSYMTVLRVSERHDEVEFEMYNRNIKAYSGVE